MTEPERAARRSSAAPGLGDSLYSAFLVLGFTVITASTLPAAGIYTGIVPAALLGPVSALVARTGRDPTTVPMAVALLGGALMYGLPFHAGRRVLHACGGAPRSDGWPRDAPASPGAPRPSGAGRRLGRALSFLVLPVLGLVVLAGSWQAGRGPAALEPVRLELVRRFPAPALESPLTAAIERAIVERTNAARAAHGVGALTADPALAAVARAQSADMLRRRYVSHVNPEGIDATGRAAAAGYPTERSLGPRRRRVGIGENLAMLASPLLPREAQAVADHLVRGWLNSPGHRENLLDPDYAVMGVGVAHDGVSFYATQNFF